MQTQTRGQLVSSEMTGGNGQQKCKQRGSWRPAAPDQRVSGNHFNLQFMSRTELGPQRFGASTNLFGGHPHHPNEWNRIMILPDIFKQRCFERGVCELVDAQCTEKGIGPHALDDFRLSAENAGLWTAEHLVPAIGHQVHTCAQAIHYAALVYA